MNPHLSPLQMGYYLRFCRFLWDAPSLNWKGPSFYWKAKQIASEAKSRGRRLAPHWRDRFKMWGFFTSVQKMIRIWGFGGFFLGARFALALQRAKSCRLEGGRAKRSRGGYFKGDVCLLKTLVCVCSFLLHPKDPSHFPGLAASSPGCPRLDLDNISRYESHCEGEQGECHSNSMI